jgi:integrase
MKSTFLHSTKSEMKPSAQSAILCDVNDSDKLESERLWNVIHANSNIDTTLKAIIEVMLLGGLRVSEVLNIKWQNISNTGQIKYKSSKGSYDGFIYPVLYRSFWINCKLNRFVFPSSYNRFFLYREFKKIGISSENRFGTKNAVTHLFRKLKATDIFNIENDIDDVKEVLRHKNINSTKFYINENKVSIKTRNIVNK